MDSNEIIARIQDELTVCYEHIGRKAPESLPVIAASLQEAVRFESPEQVHAIFMKAKDIESIPTQKVLKECLRNYSEEVLKYRAASAYTAIEYRDPRAAWLPKEPLMRRINAQTAIKNYCIAVDLVNSNDNEYGQYRRCHATKKERSGDREVAVWANPDAADAFDSRVKALVTALYVRYWRMLPMSNGYPADAAVELTLTPASVQQFRIMLDHEAKVNGYTA